MKNISWSLLLITILILVLTISCCKNTESYTESYTEKYLGDWDFHYSWSRTKYGVLNIYSGDSFDFTGVINPGSSDNYITIRYSGTNSITKKVEPDGRILNTCSENAPLHWSVSCDGYFEGDTILHYNTSETSPPNQVTNNSTELVGIKLGRNIKCRAPGTFTTAATGITGSGATLGANINPNFLSTTVIFEYGTMSGSYIRVISATPGTLSGSDEKNVSATISGLTPGTKYYFRVAALNSLGKTYGSEMTFNTNK